MGKLRSDAVAALRDSAPVGLGFIPEGIAFGVYLTHAGLAWWWAPATASVIYAGSFEFLLVGLVTALAPLAAIAMTAFLVNVRHVFYSLSFPLHRVRGRAGKTYGTFALTDEAYALTTDSRAKEWPSRRILCLQAFLHSYWIIGATLGGLLGSLIPASVRGLSFALTALFTVLAIEAIRSRPRDLPTPVLALLAAVAARLLFPGQLLLAAFLLFTIALIARQQLSRRAETTRSSHA
jgi:4-azaleucine resistance transporter AzlC